MSDTPRTDKHYGVLAFQPTHHVRGTNSDIAFARQLERELSAANRSLGREAVSDTPRTDAAFTAMVEGDFARQLERELSAARAELARVNDLLSTVRMERDGLSNRIVELANELTEAVGLLRDWRLEYRYPTLPGEVDRAHRTDDFLTKHGGGR